MVALLKLVTLVKLATFLKLVALLVQGRSHSNLQGGLILEMGWNLGKRYCKHSRTESSLPTHCWCHLGWWWNICGLIAKLSAHKTFIIWQAVSANFEMGLTIDCYLFRHCQVNLTDSYWRIFLYLVDEFEGLVICDVRCTRITLVIDFLVSVFNPVSLCSLIVCDSCRVVLST